MGATQLAVEVRYPSLLVNCYLRIKLYKIIMLNLTITTKVYTNKLHWASLWRLFVKKSRDQTLPNKYVRTNTLKFEVSSKKLNDSTIKDQRF